MTTAPQAKFKSLFEEIIQQGALRDVGSADSAEKNAEKKRRMNRRVYALANKLDSLVQRRGPELLRHAWSFVERGTDVGPVLTVVWACSAQARSAAKARVRAHRPARRDAASAVQWCDGIIVTIIESRVLRPTYAPTHVV